MDLHGRVRVREASADDVPTVAVLRRALAEEQAGAPTDAETALRGRAGHAPPVGVRRERVRRPPPPRPRHRTGPAGPRRRARRPARTRTTGARAERAVGAVIPAGRVRAGDVAHGSGGSVA